ncbi:MAG: hypothetical protein ACOZQL_35190 [Myxococcota bacterium]
MRSSFFVVVLVLVGCGTPPASIPDREAGVRAPRSAACGQLDGTRCLLPWPSNEYTVRDETSPTGLRLSIAFKSLPVKDNPISLNRADGFSVATPLAVGFPRPLAPSLHGQKDASAVRLLLAQPGREHRGERVPVRLAVVADELSSDGLLVIYPQRPLEFDADYVAVVLDEVKAADGTPYEQPALVKVALGLVAPANDDERALAAYHAPTRALLAEAGVDAAHVLRVWDFTTRSAQSVSGPLETLRAAALATVDAGTLSVEIASAELAQNDRAIDVRGQVRGLPSFLEADGGLALGGDGLPRQTGLRAAPFRAIVPAGTGSYPVVLFGHGTGGTVNDTTFDPEIIAAGAAKLNLEWGGWTEATTVNTLVGFDRVYSGTDRSTGRLLQSLGDAAAIQASLAGKLGDALAAATIAGRANPAAGRRPDVSALVYAGGSLGGTMGYVLSQSEPAIRFAVLNVPGAAWTHFAPESDLWSTLSVVFTASTPSAIDRALGMSMTQTNWDPVDGAAWAALSKRSDLMILAQESIGDPILPNIGSEFVAASSGAVQLGAVIEPIVGVQPVQGPVSRTAITQFRVPATETGLAIHGFADRGTPAGVAAREQISAFITSVWAGQPRIDVPPLCAARPNQSCDFR